jgi:hypothetical protein
VAGVWISYVLLSPVSRSLILLDVFFTPVSLAVEAVSKLFLLLVLPILSTTGYLKAFEPRQLEILANIGPWERRSGLNIGMLQVRSSAA